MLKVRLTNVLFALLAVALAGGAMLLSVGAPMVAAAPPLVLTASAEPPTPTTPPTNTPAPTNTPLPGLPPTSTPLPDVPPTAAPEPPPDEPDEGERFADPAVSKEANRSDVALGDEISFSITVTNEGNETAQGVIVEDPLPGWLALISASVDKGQAVTNGNTAGFWIGDVEPGEVVRGEVTARVVAFPEGGEGFNEVVLTATNRSDRLVNNRAAVRLRVTAPTPTPTADPALAGGQPTPTPTPTPAPEPAPAGGQQSPTLGLPVTAGSTGLPVPAWVVFVAAVGYMALGVYYWRRPRK